MLGLLGTIDHMTKVPAMCQTVARKDPGKSETTKITSSCYSWMHGWKFYHVIDQSTQHLYKIINNEGSIEPREY